MSAQALNLVPDFTPVASPRSSSMSEAFVKTLKRDHMHLALRSPTSAPELGRRIEVYSGIHPRLAPKVASPRHINPF